MREAFWEMRNAYVSEWKFEIKWLVWGISCKSIELVKKEEAGRVD